MGAAVGPANDVALGIALWAAGCGVSEQGAPSFRDPQIIIGI